MEKRSAFFTLPCPSLCRAQPHPCAAQSQAVRPDATLALHCTTPNPTSFVLVDCTLRWAWSPPCTMPCNYSKSWQGSEPAVSNTKQVRLGFEPAQIPWTHGHTAHPHGGLPVRHGYPTHFIDLSAYPICHRRHHRHDLCHHESSPSSLSPSFLSSQASWP